MKKYDAYKDSGVKWIGEIPNHWEVVPLKRTGSFENGLTYSPNDIRDGIKEQMNTIPNRYNKWLYLFHILSC